ncbi:MAG: Peptidase [Solirubrobacterales bacterium]|nr:Peptidase [Solirubrobacterales bacterium]
MRRAKTSIITTFAAAAALVPAIAGADDSGGMAASPQPAPESVSCSERCADLQAAQPGSTIRVYGRDLSGVATVVFTGKPGGADDVPVTPSKVRSRTVYATVPAKAIGGPLVLRTADGTESAPTAPIEIDHGPTRIAAKGSAPGVDAKVESRKAFFDGKRPAALNYLVQGSGPARVSVALVRTGTETVVAAWSPGVVEPGTVQRIRWNGIDANTKKSGARGRYEFRVYTSSDTASAAEATTERPTAASSFLFLDHQFPIRGHHDYSGGAAGRFGAGRNGHVHQGQDVFAACGTPLVAARGGTVKFAGWQGNAGNYIVIDGQATGVDSAYMHLAEPALFKKGDTVRTGEQIGVVGDTGDAVGCHLHFEEWSAPGWYTGGSPYDPLPDLRAWDQYS